MNFTSDGQIICPPLTPVTSSNIEALGETQGRLFVRFRGGRVYTYLAEEGLAETLIAAPSVGKAFHQLVKTKGQPYTRIE